MDMSYVHLCIQFRIHNFAAAAVAAFFSPHFGTQTMDETKQISTVFHPILSHQTFPERFGMFDFAY